jgi:hypothetical protein
MEIRLVGAELFHADGRTDRHTAMTQNLRKAPKKTPSSRVRLRNRTWVDRQVTFLSFKPLRLEINLDIINIPFVPHGVNSLSAL